MALDSVNLSFKKLVNRQYTTPNKAWYEEQSAIGFKLKGRDIWVDPIAEDPATADPSVVQEFNTLTLTEDETVNNQRAWLCKDGATRIGSFIPPLYGSGYTVQLFDNNDEQIYPTDASDWFFDYAAGVLTFGESVSGFTTPFKVRVYRYIGRTADDVASTYGPTDITGDKVFKDNVTIEGELITSGGSSVNGDLDVDGSGDIEGDLHVHGGLEVDSTSLLHGNVECSNDVLINGDLTVLGTMTTLSTQDTVIEDNMIILNNGETGSGVTAGTSGIEIDRGTSPSVQLYFDEADDLWKVTDLNDSTNRELAMEKPITTVLYVDVNRTDNYTANGAITKPFKTIANAIVAAGSGDIIEILPGTYTENLSINKNLKLRSVDKNLTTLNGRVGISADVHMTKLSINCNNSVAAVSILAGSVSKMSIIDTNVTNAQGQGIYSSGGVLQNAIIINNTIEGNPSLITENGTNNCIIRDNIYHENGTTDNDGVILYEPMTNTTFERNQLSGFNRDGLIVGEGSGSQGSGLNVFRNNDIRDCGRNELVLKRGANLEIYSNTIDSDDEGHVNILVETSTIEDMVVSRFDTNSILGPQAMMNNKSGFFDALHNWWGASDGPDDSYSYNTIQGSGGALYEKINAEPFITKGNRAVDVRNTSSVPGHTVEDALNWLETTGSPTTQTIYVDKQRVDTYTPDGSEVKPYKTISNAIQHIIDVGDNSLTNPYVLYISSGIYSEDVILDSTSLVNLIFNSLDNNSVVINPSSGDSLSVTSNDNLSKLHFNNFDFQNNVELTGNTEGTDFGDDVVFNNCNFANILTLNNLNVCVLNNSQLLSDLNCTNTNYVGLVNCHDIDSGNLNITADNTLNKPNGFSESNVHLINSLCPRDVSWTLNGASAVLKLSESVFGSDDASNLTIPVNATINCLNTTLRGNYTWNGILNLTNSYVTGELSEGSGTLNLNQPFNQLAVPTTTTLLVDMNRTDTYTEDGSLARPFKSLSDAISNASSGDIIKIQNGSYMENISLPNGVSLIGSDRTACVVDGSVTTGSGQLTITGITVNDSLNINSDECVLNDVKSGRLNIDNGIVDGNNVAIDSLLTTGISEMLNLGGTTSIVKLTNLDISGNVEAINHTSGTLMINQTEISYESTTSGINIGGDRFILNDATLTNNGSGSDVLELTNSPSANLPNVLNNIVSSKNIKTNTSNTIVCDVFATVMSSAANRANIMLQPVSQIANDTAILDVDIVNGDTAKAAMERVAQTCRYDETLESMVFDPCWGNIT